jgi:hypothetical protein
MEYILMVTWLVPQMTSYQVPFGDLQLCESAKTALQRDAAAMAANDKIPDTSQAAGMVTYPMRPPQYSALCIKSK